jgi:hypothetical protein
MTDYRLRNHDLLYAGRAPQPLASALTWRNVVIFGAIAATATLTVVGHLTDRFSATATGPAMQRAAGPAPAIHLATPGDSRSGS